MEDILVTGANGFLGTHLTKRLESFTSIPHDAIQTNLIYSFDKFFFLSTYGNMHSHKDDDQIIKANVSDLVHVLSKIDMSKSFKSFVFVSTSSVRLKRQTMYSRTKRAAEEILLSYADKYNVPICIVRPFSITGVGEQPEHLIPKLIDSCLEGTPMDFVPRPVHDFIDVEDVVDGILTLAQHGAQGIFELGRGESYTNQEVLKLVEKVTGFPANIDVITSMRDYDVSKTAEHDWASYNNTIRRYGWAPKKTLEQSITEMVAAYVRV